MDNGFIDRYLIFVTKRKIVEYTMPKADAMRTPSS